MKRKLLSLLTAMCLIMTLLPATAFAVDAVSTWDGTTVSTGWYDQNTSASEFTINTAADLAGLAKLVNEGTSFSKTTIKLGADIDLAGKEWTPIGTSTNPFKGTFDGKKSDAENYTISHMTVNGTSYLGLFGVTDGATVQNLNLSDVKVTGSSNHTGALAGQTKATSLTNVTVSGAVVTNEVYKYGNAYAGGLTGEGFTGKIEGCVVENLTLTTQGAFVGGISGQGYASINNCIVRNSSITTGYWKVGGIIGQLNEGNFTFTGNKVLDTTIASTSTSGSVGGIIGFSNYGNKKLTNNTVSGVILNSSVGAGGLIGSISSQANNNFSFADCKVRDVTFQSEGTITTSGGLIGEKYWRGSAGTTFAADDCTVSNIKVDAAEGSKVGALFGSFGTDGNTYTVTDVIVTAGDSKNAVSQLVGKPNLGSSTFTMSGEQTVIDAAYAGEAVDYLDATTVLEKKGDGAYGVVSNEGQAKVAFNRDQITYYISLHEAFAAAASGDHIVVLTNEASGTATLTTNVTLEPGSYALPAITVAEGANLTISGSGTLKSALTNNGIVTVDQDTTVTSYAGSGVLATNLAGKRVQVSNNTLVVYNIPYVFEINGVKYEDMPTAAAAIGASWDADTSTLTLGQDVSITNTVGILTPIGSMTLELNGHRLDWPADSNVNGTPLIVAEASTTLTVQDSSAAQTGRLVADKSNVFQGKGAIVLKSGTVEAKSGDIYSVNLFSAGFAIQGGTVIAAEGKAIGSSYVNITGGTFNVLPSKSSVGSGYAVVQIGGSYRALPVSQLESGIAHGAVIATQVNGTYYASLKNAIDAAMAGTDKTITLLSDITADSWNMIWNVTGITLDGNGHTIKVNDIQSGQNHDAVFHSAGGNTFKNLTIDLSGISSPSQAQGYRAFSAAPSDSFSKVTVIGNQYVSYGITVGGTETGKDETISIDGCSFTNCGYGVYSDLVTHLEKLTITNSTFTGCGYASILYTENVAFTGNTVSGGKLNIMHDAQTVTGNTFTDSSRIKFYDKPAAFEKNSISADSKLDANTGVSGINVSENYWGGGAPSEEQLGGVKVTGNEVYYTADTMNPEDLNTYVSSSSTTYPITVNKADNGTVTASRTRASKNLTITLTVKANEGYKLNSLTATDKNGNDVKLTDKGSGKYTFAMPASAVTVKATFVKDETPVETGLPFTDVKAGDWFYEAVKYVYDNKLMDGTSSTTFAPMMTTNRAMILTILARYDGVDTSTGSTWYEAGAAWAVAEGVSDGTNLEANLTREQLVTMLWRYAGSPVAEGDLSDYPDSASVSDWAVSAMIWAVENGIITGTGTGALNPQGTATRAEVATILMRFIEK